MDTNCVRQQLEDFLESERDKANRGVLNPFEVQERAEQILQRVDYTTFPQVGSQYEEIHNLYKLVAQFLFREQYIHAAINWLIKRWEELGEIQGQERNQHIHRAAISMELVDSYLILRDRGAALRWALLTHADDILHGIDNGGAGKQKLLANLGMTVDELERFDRIAEKNKNDVNGQNDWSVAEGFAEDVIVRFALEHPEAAHLLAQDSFISEFPLSKLYFQKLLERVKLPIKSEKNPNGIKKKKKGDYLEYLASYLFLLIPGWIPLVKRQDEEETFEQDIVVRNSNQNTYTADLLGRHFLVECKNWDASKLGSSDVGYFLFRMQLLHSKFGIIFSSCGISGQNIKVPKEKNATFLIRKAHHDNKGVCIVVDNNHLETLAQGEKTFWSLLLELIEKFRFGNRKEKQKLHRSS